MVLKKKALLYVASKETGIVRNYIIDTKISRHFRLDLTTFYIRICPCNDIIITYTENNHY